MFCLEQFFLKCIIKDVKLKVNNPRGSFTFKFNIFIIQFREKCSKQKMKKTFGENVLACEDFSLNRKENELHRKYKVLGGLRKMLWLLQF